MDGVSITLEVMVRHHTKDKGDLGVAKVHADLASQGFTVLFPATEHAPFDLVAYEAGVVPPPSGEVPLSTLGRRHREVPVHMGGPQRDPHDTD